MSDFVVNKENLLKGGWYIEITNEKHCEQVQLALFELGVFWNNGDSDVKGYPASFIYLEVGRTGLS